MIVWFGWNCIYVVVWCIICIVIFIRSLFISCLFDFFCVWLCKRKFGNWFLFGCCGNLCNKSLWVLLIRCWCFLCSLGMYCFILFLVLMGVIFVMLVLWLCLFWKIIVISFLFFMFLCLMCWRLLGKSIRCWNSVMEYKLFFIWLMKIVLLSIISFCVIFSICWLFLCVCWFWKCLRIWCVKFCIWMLIFFVLVVLLVCGFWICVMMW